MAWITEYTCDKCQKVEEAPSGYMRCYVVDWQKELIHFSSRIVWCYTCNQVQAAELVPELSTLECIRANITEAGLPEDIQMTTSSSPQALQEWLDKLDALIQWRKDRKSASRCLTCGATAIKVLEVEASVALETFEHPGCGGICRFNGNQCHLNTSVMFEYTSEGIRIPTN